MEEKQEQKKNTSGDFFSRMGTMGELLRFMWKRKLYWLLPMMIFLVILIFIVVAGGTAAPFIYTLF
jgi:uncharacterized protein involved in cysteine biosynthesis